METSPFPKKDSMVMSKTNSRTAYDVKLRSEAQHVQYVMMKKENYATWAITATAQESSRRFSYSIDSMK